MAGTCTLTSPGGQPFEDIAVDGRFACGRTTDSQTACLDTRPCTRFFEHAEVVQIMAAPVPCARMKDHRVVCEDPNADQRSVPQGYAEVPPVSATSLAGSPRYACAQPADGSAPVCWGRVHDGRSAMPAGEGWTALSGSDAGMCASRPGDTRCWPWGGQVDRAWPGLRSAPRYSPELAVGVADGVAMALRGEDAVELGPAREVDASSGVVCWTGDDGTACTLSEDAVAPPDVPLHSLSSLHGLICGLDEDGRTHCFGEGAKGPEVTPELRAAVAQGLLPDGVLRHPNRHLAWLPALPAFDVLTLSDALRACGRVLDQSAIVCWNKDGIETALEGEGPYG